MVVHTHLRVSSLIKVRFVNEAQNGDAEFTLLQIYVAKTAPLPKDAEA